MSANRTLNLTGRGALVFGDGATRTTTLKSAASLADDLIFILPPDAGTAGYLLSTDGNGTLSWQPSTGTTDFGLITLTGQGPVRFNDADDSDYVALTAPAALASTYTLVFPDDLPGSPSFIQVATDGTMSFAAGTATLQSAYDSSEAVTIADGVPITLTGDNPSGTLLALIGDDDSTDPLLDITNPGAGAALRLVQTGDAPALDASKTAGSTPIASLTGSGAISGAGLQLSMPSAGSGIALDLSNAGSGIGARLTQATTDAVLAQINQGTNAIGLDVNKTGAGAGAAVDIDNDGTGIGLNVKQDGSAIGAVVTQATANAAVQINQGANSSGLDLNKTGAGAGTALDIDDDGTGTALNIVKDGAGRALEITQNGNALSFQLTQTQNQKAARIFKSGAGAGTALEVENDGTGKGLNVLQDGDAVCAEFAAASASGEAVLQLTHGSSDPLPDVQGTSARWSVTNKGAAAFKRVAIAGQTYTISSGAVTIGSGGFLRLAGEGGVADNLDNILSDSGDPVLDGTLVVLKAVSDTVTITVRDTGGGTGNLRLAGAGNFALDSIRDTITFVYDADQALWLEITQSSNGS